MVTSAAITEPHTNPVDINLRRNGVYMGVAYQGGSVALCGIFIVGITSYPGGTFAMKLHGQTKFENVSVSANYLTKNLTISSTEDIGFNVKIYEIY